MSPSLWAALGVLLLLIVAVVIGHYLKQDFDVEDLRQEMRDVEAQTTTNVFEPKDWPRRAAETRRGRHDAPR